jgi:hypothetical protein
MRPPLNRMDDREALRDVLADLDLLAERAAEVSD